ncbi:tetratricopeptide repeat protein [Roseibium sp.]|uniref:tetratricopeptide repeat protein n=1 Tax=Roseibium sp. TaxID=1936156 RepID=UPI003D0F6FE9
MSDPEATDDLSITEARIRRQLKRILDFSGLEASDRRREMLIFIVEEALAGRASGLKASTIAMAVFDRGSDFDQQTDPVVRLEARKLRRDLDNYYANAGRDDPVLISIPKGRYIPRFSALNAVKLVDTPARASGSPGFNGGPDGAETVSSLPPDKSAGHRNLHLALLAATIFFCTTLVLLWFGKSNDPAASGSQMPADGARVLVMRFEAHDTDELSPLLAAGLSQEIAAALLNFPDLRVHLGSGPGTVDAGLSDMARLRAATEFVVTGNVLRENDDILVRAKLLRSEDSQVLWSERYSIGTEAQGMSKVQDDISAQIATVVGQRYGIAMNDARKTLLSDDESSSLTDYACIARAQIYRRTIRQEEYQEARDCLETAVRRDPEYARAWAMLAYLRMDAARFSYDETLPEDAKYAPARKAAIRALTLNSNDIDALKALSHIEQYKGNFEQAIEYARQAVEVNPNDPDALANLGNRLGIRNRLSEAVPLLKRAIERSVSPVPFYYHMIALDHMMKGEWDDMLLAANHAVADGSSVSYALVAIAHGALGNSHAARENLDKMAERWPLLAEDPRAAFELHKLHPVIIDQIVAGLDRAGQAQLE